MTKHNHVKPNALPWSGDPGGFNRSSFGGGPDRKVSFRPALDDEPIGAEDLAENELLGTIRQRLSREPRVIDDEIIIGREGRVIELRGRVPNAEQKEIATIVARGTPGVKAVENELLSVPASSL